MSIQNFSKLTAQLLTILAIATGCSINSPREVSDAKIDNTPVSSVADTSTADPSAVAGASANSSTSTSAKSTQETSTTNTQPVRYFVGDSGIAIRGTDPVAYFTQGRPTAGRAEYTYSWNNVTWQFDSAENRDLFAANPEQYAPQYGGFCAWAVSEGYTAPIDPNAWRIVDDKLYLNYSRNIQRRWERDIPGNISKANANWPELL